MDGDWQQVGLFLAILVPSVILHEISHGWAALRLGDDTAKRRGRLTLNPLAHVDPFGTVLLPALLALSGFGVIGYAKPVPVNVRRLRRPRDHAVLVALAGPATNLLIALGAAAVVRVLGGVDVDAEHERLGGVGVVEVAYLVGFFNVLLALFNLLPIPPLDGSAVVERALPRRWYPTWLRLRRWSFGIVLVAFLLFGVGRYVIEPAVAVWEALV